MPEFNDWFPSSLHGIEHVNAKAFGAIGDGNYNYLGAMYASYAAAVVDYPKTTSTTWTTDTADWCGIQAAIDYALENRIVNVFIPEGRYLTSDTLHCGYGMRGGASDFTTCHIIGAGKSSLSGDPSGTNIVPLFVDRPVVNIQGGRNSGVRHLRIAGSVVVPDNTNHPSLNHRADPLNYTPTGAQDDPHAPFCGVCIDGYSAEGASGELANIPPGTYPGTAYPTPRFPAWVQSNTNAYNKSLSSACFIEDCEIVGTLIGIMQQPYDNGNGDFTKCMRTNIWCCKVAVAVGNSQARNMDFTNMTLDGCHTGWDTSNYGQGIGNLQGTFHNIGTGGVYWIFYAVSGGSQPLHIVGMYGELNISLGKFPFVTVWDGCSLGCHDCVITSQTPAISSITWSGGLATLTTGTPLATYDWLSGTRRVVISAAPSGYSGEVIATRTGANTFTYPVASNPGTYLAGSLIIPHITEWLLEPFFEGPGRFRDCIFYSRTMYHFVGDVEIHNCSFLGLQGQYPEGGLFSEGHRKAHAALGRVVINQSAFERSAPSRFTGNHNAIKGRVDGASGTYEFEADVNGWDGYNSHSCSSLWGIGQKDDGYVITYDIPPMARYGQISAAYSALSGITATITIATEISHRAEVGDIIKMKDHAWWAVEAVGAGPTYALTIKQITNFKMQSGVYTSLDSILGVPEYYPIGSLDLMPSSIYAGVDGAGGYTDGIFMKTTTGSPTISFVNGNDVAVNRPANLTLTSKPLFMGQKASFYASTIPFQFRTLIDTLAPTATTLTMSSNALVTGTYAYGPGIKRLK